jgi:S-layer homology domain
MMNQACRIVAVVLGIALAVTLVARRAEAQSSEPRTFGPTSAVSHTVPAFSFTEFALTNNNTSQAYNSDINTGARFCTLINCRLLAPVQLPAGAHVTRIEVDGCDTNPGANFSVVLRRSQLHEGGTTQLASADSAGNPGCVFVIGDLATPETIDNRNNTYFLDYIDGGTNDASLRFTAVRIFYTLQVSPAPATATFGDVPTSHPFFQFIEALVRSGITVGCGDGSDYCPDDPLTRGQMAVFMSKGLGLHFAP